jgi:hypothetical protein
MENPDRHGNTEMTVRIREMMLSPSSTDTFFGRPLFPEPEPSLRFVLSLEPAASAQADQLV